LSNELRAYLTHQTSNELSLSAGEIYFHILRCDPADTRTIDSWWAQVHSVDEARELKRLLARKNLNAPFRALAKMPASGRGLLAGCIGSLLRLKCDEEVIRYLTHIYDSWSHLLDHSVEAMQKIDVHTVECLESRNPANSVSDEEYLKPLIVKGLIFESFTVSQRERIWRNLKSYPRRIPSIRIFLHDIIYFEMLANCVKKLVQPRRRETLFKALGRCFVGSSPPSTPFTGGVGDVLQFDISYRKLYLSAMRYLESLRPGSVLLERGETRQTQEKDGQLWYNFAQEAHRLGFRSPSITNLLSQNPDRIEASSTLLRARSSDIYQYDVGEFESLVDQIVTFYSKARKVDEIEETPSLVCSGSGEEIKRRSGRPFRKAHEESARFLTFDNMQIADVDDVGELTPFFVRRDVYLSFFGNPDRSNTGQQPEPTSMQRPSNEPQETNVETSNQHHADVMDLVLHDGVSDDPAASVDPAAAISETVESNHRGDRPEHEFLPSRHSQSPSNRDVSSDSVVHPMQKC
jgi:hypothetical protein